MSYHVINLAVQLFLRLLAILTEMAQKSTIGNAQVNPKKIRQNLLSEYFEKMSCGQLKKRVLNQLRYFLKNTCDLELKAVFYEFISMSLYDSYLEVSYNDFCSLRIESFVCGNDSKCRNPFENLIQHSNWKIRLAAVYEMLKHLQSRTDFVGHILDFLESGTNDPSHLILLLNKPNLAEYISADVNLRTKLLNICSETLQNNPSDERVILNLLRFAKEMAALSSLENLQSFLGYVK